MKTRKEISNVANNKQQTMYFMSKKEEKTEVAAQGETLPATTNNAKTNTALSKKQQDLDQLFQVGKTAEGEEITSEYLNFDKWSEGDSEHFIVTGMTEMQNTKGKEGGMIPAVELLNEDQRKLINADAVMCSTCARELEKSDGKPFLIEVVFAGWKKSSNGDYRDLRIVRKTH